MARRASVGSRIRGCLVGAAVGAELGFARCVERDRFKAGQPGDMFGLPLAPCHLPLGLHAAACSAQEDRL